MKRTAWLWWCVLLAGCGGVPTQAPEKLAATHGYVHVLLPAASTPEAPLALLSPADPLKPLVLLRQPEIGPHVYGLWLPPGEYDIAGLRNADGGRYPPVPVLAGRMTDLGGIVELPVGGRALMLLPFRHPETAEATQAAAAWLRPHLSRPEALEWWPRTLPAAQARNAAASDMSLGIEMTMLFPQRDNRPSVRKRLAEAKTPEAFFRIARSASPPQSDQPASDAHGTLFYGAPLGQLRLRRSDGSWDSIDTGTLQSITAVGVGGTRFIAGTADGALRISDDSGQRWRPLVALAPEDSVIGIDRVATRWLVLTAHLTPKSGAPGVVQTERLKLYSAGDDNPAALTLLREIALSERREVAHGIGLAAQVMGQAYYVNAGSEILKLDVPSGQWSAIKPPFSATGFNLSRQNGLMTAYRSGSMYLDLAVSPDQTVWREIGPPLPPVYDIVFLTPNQGIATRVNSDGFDPIHEYMRYIPGSSSWVRDAETPRECLRLLRDAENLQRFCVTRAGSVMQPANGTWLIEFPAD